MTLFLPDSIAGRTMIVLLVGLTLSHVASTLFLTTDRHESLERLCADHIAVIADLIARVPPQDRARLAGNAASGIALSDQPPPDEAGDRDKVALMQAALQPFFGTVAPSRLHVGGHAEGTGPHQSMMHVSLRLDDGQWVSVAMAVGGEASTWSQHAAQSTVTMMIAVLVFGGWATGWISRPLATFAAAADRLGRDVTAPRLPEGGPREVRRAVAAFNEMQARLRRFVEDRTQMLAAIAHDLRSPITRLRLRTELLPEGEGRDKMLADLDDMESMVASSLAFARDEAADEAGQAFDLAATLGAVCDNAVDLGLRAEFAWEGRLVCTGRPAAIRRALANLVENAARYGQQAEVAARRDGADLVVTIDDRGPGIPEDQRERVFAPFTRLEGSRNRKTGGIGLGLSVARSIIRAHGGDIRLADRPGGGLRVVVTLPQDGPR
jgi:signal transduction histidine kinase